MWWRIGFALLGAVIGWVPAWVLLGQTNHYLTALLLAVVGWSVGGMMARVK